MKKLKLSVTLVLLFLSMNVYAQWDYSITSPLGYAVNKSDDALLKKRIDGVHRDIYKLLPSLKRKIHINVVFDSSGVIPETGEVGIPLTSDTVEIKINPFSKRTVRQIIEESFRPTLMHELHHLERGWVIKGRAPSKTFMDAVVAEGMATCFERDFGHTTPLAAQYPPNVEEWVKELMALPNSAFRNYYQWMIQHPDGRRWIGYKAGVYIIEKASSASKKTSAELVNTSTEEILKLAGL
jgi:hypothetical protein